MIRMTRWSVSVQSSLTPPYGTLLPGSTHHQFLLGFRAIAGSIAEWEAWLELLESLPTGFYTVDATAVENVRASLSEVDPVLKPESTEARCDCAVAGQDGTGGATGRADYG